GYDEARTLWNAMIDRKPAIVVRAADASDVVHAVEFAREHQLLLAVRAEGYNIAGKACCDGGLLLDVSPMKAVRIDAKARTAYVEPGAVLSDFDREAQAHGLATPLGINSTTGVAGFTLGGGIGWIMRKYGLTVDNLLSVDVVTADGEFVKASEDENADLFWGIRGGGGNFGIVTDFEFRLQPLGPIVVAGPIFWPMEKSPEVLRFYRDWLADAPDELMTILIHRKAPPLPFVPEEFHGKPVVMVIPCYAGPVEDGEKVVRPMKEFASPIIDLCEPKPFVVHQAMFDPS